MYDIRHGRVASDRQYLGRISAGLRYLARRWCEQHAQLRMRKASSRMRKSSSLDGLAKQTSHPLQAGRVHAWTLIELVHSVSFLPAYVMASYDQSCPHGAPFALHRELRSHDQAPSTSLLGASARAPCGSTHMTILSLSRSLCAVHNS